LKVRKRKEKMSVSQTPGFRFSDLDYEVQDLISAIKQSEICLERWDIDEYDRQFHRNLIANCANQLRNIWYPESSN